MLVWYDVIFVLRVERLVLGWDIDFLWCKVRATIKFLGYFSISHGNKTKGTISVDGTDRSELGWGKYHRRGERGIYLEKVREAGLF